MLRDVGLSDMLGNVYWVEFVECLVECFVEFFKFVVEV